MKFLLTILFSFFIGWANGQIVGIEKPEFIDSLPDPDPPDTTTHSDGTRHHLLRSITYEEVDPLAAPWHHTVPATHCYPWSQRIQSDTFSTPGPTGHALSIHLERGDCDASGSRRSEIDLKVTDPPNAIRWLGIQKYFKGPYTSDPAPEIIFQWHHVQNDGSPPVAVQIRNDQFALVTRTCKTGCNENVAYMGPVPKNQWVDFVVYYNMRSDGAGEVKVWINDVLKADVTGAVSFPGVGNVLKTGLYKWPWGSTYTGNSGIETVREQLEDNLYYGDENATYADVDPTP